MVNKVCYYLGSKEKLDELKNNARSTFENECSMYKFLNTFNSLSNDD